jgi:TRAP-type mannitol/chloroaromatic compound transport system permease small subunit
MTTGQDAVSTIGTAQSVPTMVRWSETIGKFTESIGKAATLFFLPLILITMWDVFQRKVMKVVGDVMLDWGWLEARDWMYDNLLTLLPFRSTLLQELEWHFHTAAFVLVLGYGYIYNRHVRVDLIREKLAFRKQAWIELIGCTVFMIPYCVVVGYFAIDYAVQSYEIHEQSSSLVGLHNRWAIKAVLALGLLLAGFAGLAIWLQTAFALFGRGYTFPLYTIERQEEKLEKRMILEEANPLADREAGETRTDSSKLMSRQISAEAFQHATETRGQQFFYYTGIAVITVVLVLLFHTFNFWGWIID